MVEVQLAFSRTDTTLRFCLVSTTSAYSSPDQQKEALPICLARSLFAAWFVPAADGVRGHPAAVTGGNVCLP